MRKLKLQMQVSVDGYVAGPQGEMDWMVWDWDDALKQYVGDLTNSCDAILLGRVLALGFMPHWATLFNDPTKRDESSEYMHLTKKYVFSKSMLTTNGNNAEIVSGDLVEEVRKLKNSPGLDIITYGGSSFAGSLVKNNLVDELYLFVNPTAIGSGMPLFRSRSPLCLKATQQFACGITAMVYEPRKETAPVLPDNAQ